MEPIIVTGACHHDCPDTCVWDVEVSDGVAVDLRGNADHPTTAGQLCPKVNRFLDRVYHADRLLTPLRRVGAKGHTEFEPISWSEALEEIAARFANLRSSPGAESILQFSFDGTQGVIQKGVMADRFFDALGASDIGRHLCGATAGLGAADVSGVPYGIDPTDLRHAKTIVLWGTNTFLTNRHLWPFVEQARASGAQVVVIDPIHTATASKADVFLRIRPGTDTALVLGLIHVLDRDGLVDREWLQGNTSGWEDLRRSAEPMAPHRAAEITGIDETQIVWLARTFVERRPAAVRSLVGPEHREHGRELMRAIALLPAVTGAWRDVGGGLARSTQVYFEAALAYPQRSPRRTFNMAMLGSVLGDRTLDPPIEALVVHNSNPAVILPDQNRVIEGLERDDLFTVVIDQFMTDTARYADIVLPATTQLEHLDLSIAWGHLYLALNRPAIAPVGESLANTEIFRRLAAQMGFDDPALQEDDETLIRGLLDSDHAWLGDITYELLVERTWARLRVPDGHRPNVDMAPQTPDGRLALGPLEYRPGSESIEAAATGPFPLLLLSRKQHVKFLNANYGGFEDHFPSDGEPLLEMHPTDASVRGIASGARVRVWNARGSLEVPARISEDVQPGVVAYPFGWWNTTQGRSVNVLTNATVGADGLGSAHFHDTLVEVTALT